MTVVLGRWPSRARRGAPLVLVAEPDHLRAALIVAGLDDRGVAALWVAQGEAALELAEEREFDAHVVDPSLRGVAGDLVLHTLGDEHPGVPLVSTATARAPLHFVSERLPVAEVVELACAALEWRDDLSVTGTQLSG